MYVWLSEGVEACDFMCRNVSMPPTCFAKNIFGDYRYAQIAYCALVFCVGQNVKCVFGNAPLTAVELFELSPFSVDYKVISTAYV